MPQTTPPAGWDSAPATTPPPGWDAAPSPVGTSSAAFDVPKLADLWVKAGGDPSKAQDMARVAYAESAGNPHAANPAGTGVGLWQINPKAHGKGNWTDPLTNARKAVELYNESGLAPWADSRDKGAGGGWGQFVHSMTTPIFGTASAAQTAPPPGWDKGTILHAPPPGWNDANAPAGAPQPPKRDVATTIQKYLAAPPAKKGAVLAQDPRLHAAAKAEVKARDEWDWIRAHKGEAVMDILGAPQRFAAGNVYAGQHNLPWAARLKHVGESVFHPTNTNSAQDTAALAAASGMAPHSEIDKWVESHMTDPHLAGFKPYMKSMLKGGEDFLLQTSSDPLQLVSGDAAVQAARKFAQLKPVAQTFATAMTLLHKMPPQAAAPFKAIVDNTFTKWMHNTFGVRPELDEKAGGLFTPRGKKIRMQIESAESGKAAENRTLDMQALKAGKGDERLKLYILQHGSATQRRALLKIDPSLANHPSIKSGAMTLNPTGSLKGAGRVVSTLRNFGAMTPEEQAAFLEKARKSIQQGETARRTRVLAQQAKPGEEIMARGINPFDPSVDWEHIARPVTAAGKKAVETRQAFKTVTKNVTGPLRQVGKMAVFLNPLPHGVMNVGTLTAWGGGLPAVAKGLAGVVVPPSEAVIKRLQQIGAHPSYVDRTYGFADKVPVYGQWLHTTQNMMQHMENAWRASLLSELDRTLGPSKSAADEMMKGWLVNEKAGNYQAQSAFVKAFEAVGGPFVVFRLGIVPRAAAKTLAEHPGRIAATTRLPVDYQQNRPKADQSKNVFEPGGVTSDMERGVTDPLGYMTSPASLGALGLIFDYYRYDQNKPWSTQAQDMLTRFNPLGEPMQLGSEMIGGGGQPGKKETLSDRLMTSMMQSLGAYYAKLPSAKSIHDKHRQHTRAGL